MKSSSSLIGSISIMVLGIIVSLVTAYAAPLGIIFHNLPVAHAQSSSQSVDSQSETRQTTRSIVLEGTVTSSQDPLPGHEGQEMATILPFRQDGSLYSGILTYTATAPVDVTVLNMQILNETEQEILNATDNGEFETVIAPQLDDETSLSVSYIIPQYTSSPVSSASIPFAGNAVWLHTIDGTPFTATFAVNALVLPSEIRNIISGTTEADDADVAEEGGAVATEETADVEETGDAGTGNTTDSENTTASEVGGVTEEDEESTAGEETAGGGAAASAAASGQVVVRIPEGASELTDDAYTPNPVEINTGDTVVWVNDDITSHTATSGTSGSGPTGMFGGTDDSPEIIGPEGDTQSFTFEEAGEFDYYCTLHPNMIGTVIVTDE
ncbi:MAG: plastocyanin/azurin family copper-binding protein [Nitrososphaera sp.]